jgi:hypothetical protein
MKTMQLATDFENEKKKELEHKKQLILDEQKKN